MKILKRENHIVLTLIVILLQRVCINQYFIVITLNLFILFISLFFFTLLQLMTKMRFQLLHL